MIWVPEKAVSGSSVDYSCYRAAEVVCESGLEGDVKAEEVTVVTV